MYTMLAIVQERRSIRNFVEYCLMFATELNLKIEFCFVQDPDLFPLGIPGSTGTAVVEVIPALEKISSSVLKTTEKHVQSFERRKGKKIPVTYSTEIGTPSVLLNEKVARNHIFMVVIEDDNTESQEIMNQVFSPVLVISPESRFKPLKKIIYVTDYKVEDIPALKRVIEITRKFNPEIIAMHVSEHISFQDKLKSSGFEVLIREKTGYNKISVQVSLDPGQIKIYEIINEFAEEMNADMIVILREHKRFLEKLFERSTFEKLLNKTDLPVLIFYENE